VERQRPVEVADKAEQETDKAVVRIGLISDTHGWLDPAVAEHFSSVDLILHAGDVGNEEILEQLAEVAPVAAVRGNVDGGPLRDLPEELVIDVAGQRVAMRHIAGGPRRPGRAAAALIERESPDVFVCGHSHVPVATRVADTLWVNPGAAGREGSHEERMVHILELFGEGEAKLLRIHLGPRGRARGPR
jgi:hypothetical protein